MKAEPRAQLRLLDLQKIDSTLQQLERQRTHLPVLARLADLAEQRSAAGDHLVRAQTAQSDVQRELAKCEADVQLVRDRAARDQARLDAGTGSPKDLQALQHELVSLARRQGDLEEIELDAMERAERADEIVAEAKDAVGALDSQIAEASAERDEALAALSEQVATTGAPRPQVVAELPGDLLALYEKLRADKGGVGAAMLHARRCLGCQLEVNAADLAAIRAAAADEVLRCEECGRILVRTPESGL